MFNPVKTKPFKPNQIKIENRMGLVVPNQTNDIIFKKPEYMDMIQYIKRSKRINQRN